MLVLISPFAVLSAAVFRGGPLLRLFGIAVVRGDGGEASRARAFGRALVAWLPWLWLAIAALPALMRARASSGSVYGIGYAFGRALGQVTVFRPDHTHWIGMAAAAFLLGALAALVTPQRGLQDRIAGTYLVLR